MQGSCGAHKAHTDLAKSLKELIMSSCSEQHHGPISHASRPENFAVMITSVPAGLHELCIECKLHCDCNERQLHDASPGPWMQHPPPLHAGCHWLQAKVWANDWGLSQHGVAASAVVESTTNGAVIASSPKHVAVWGDVGDDGLACVLLGCLPRS